MCSEFGVIFDCDGILLNSMPFWRSLDDRLAEMAGVSLTPEEKDMLTACNLHESAQYMHEHCGLGSSVEEVSELIDRELLEFYGNNPAPKPGALAFVSALHSAGVPMAVASSTPPEPLRLGLASAGFAPYMESIVSVDDVKASKRRPDVYDKARESLGTERKHTWGFEDALYAIHTLKDAGFLTFAVFDSDLAGTADKLATTADMFAMSFNDIDPERFIVLAKDLVRKTDQDGHHEVASREQSGS